jgi:hypothetical protein
VNAARAAQKRALRPKLDEIFGAKSRQRYAKVHSIWRDGLFAGRHPGSILRRYAGLEDRELDLEVAVA